MVDLLTVIPIWVTYNRELPVLEHIATFRDAVLYCVFALTTTRILRILRIRKHLLNIEDAIDRCLGEISLSIVVMIVFSKYSIYS